VEFRTGVRVGSDKDGGQELEEREGGQTDRDRGRETEIEKERDRQIETEREKWSKRRRCCVQSVRPV